MFIQVNDARGKPIDRCRVVLAAIGLNNPDGSPQSDDKVTREGGNVAWSWYPTGPGFPAPSVSEFELRVNTYEPLAAYGKETRRVSKAQLETEQQVFTLADAGSAPGPTLSTVHCPNSGVEGRGTPAEWKAITHAIVAKLPPGAIMEPDRQNGGSGQQPNLRFVHDELRKVDPRSGLQLSSGGELKPRVFGVSMLQDGSGPPESPCGQYSRPFDIGSFGRPFFHSSDGNTDVWQLTGRPPSSQW